MNTSWVGLHTLPAPSRRYLPGLHIRRCAAGGYVCRHASAYGRDSQEPPSAVTMIPFPKNYGTISNEVFILPPSLRPALAHAGTPCGQWITVQFPNAMPE